MSLNVLLVVNIDTRTNMRLSAFQPIKIFSHRSGRSSRWICWIHQPMFGCTSKGGGQVQDNRMPRGGEQLYTKKHAYGHSPDIWYKQQWTVSMGKVVWLLKKVDCWSYHYYAWQHQRSPSNINRVNDLEYVLIRLFIWIFFNSIVYLEICFNSIVYLEIFF